jgi:hypothetical protein
MTHKLIKTDNYLLVVDDSEIKEGDYFFFKQGIVTKVYKSDSVEQKVSIENFEHDRVFNYKECKKIISHLPLNASLILEGVYLLPPYHQEDGVEELAKQEYPKTNTHFDRLDECDGNAYYRSIFKKGYNKAREKYKYTEEDMRKAIDMAHEKIMTVIGNAKKYSPKEIIQSFHKYPTEFDTEDVLTPSQIFYPNDVPYCSPKTITTAQGIQWVGKYKF